MHDTLCIALTLMRVFISKNTSEPQGYFGGCVISTFLQTTKPNPESPLVALLNRLADSWEMHLRFAIEVLKEKDEKHMT